MTYAGTALAQQQPAPRIEWHELPEDVRQLSITEKTYEAAMLRLRRWARTNLQGEEPS